MGAICYITKQLTVHLMPVLQQICRVTGKPFEVSELEQELLQRAGTLHPMLKESFPLVDIHPLERLRMVFALSSTTSLYNAKSAISGQPQISRFDPALPYKICTYDEFFSDAVDNTLFGRDYDFSRPFFEQWHELTQAVYLCPLNNNNAVNSPYANGAGNVKNCYLVSAAFDCEDCAYGTDLSKCISCFHCVKIQDCQNCYMSADLQGCYACFFCQHVRSSSDCIASFDLVGCKNCLGCVGLRYQEYCIYNEQKTKEEYEAFLQEHPVATHSAEFLSGMERLRTTMGHVLETNMNIQNSTGEFLTNSTDSQHCYFSDSLQNCAYVVAAHHAKDSAYAFIVRSELVFGGTYADTRLSWQSFSCFGGEGHMYNLYLFQNCNYCFGCSALRGKSYCILNKQYTKEEYEALLPRIIAHMKSTGEWGQPTPVRYSPHSYEDATAHKFLAPIPEEEARRRGYFFADLPKTEQNTSGVPIDALPLELTQENIHSILEQTFLCPVSQNLMRFTSQEVAFCLQFRLPLPRKHWKVVMHELCGQRGFVPAV